MTGSNPVLAPIRRWVLYSRTHLFVTIFSVIGVMIVIGNLFGETPSDTNRSKTDVTAEPGAAAEVLTEVTEDNVAGEPPSWTSPPAVAMSYLRTYLDAAMPQEQWLQAVGQWTAAPPGSSVISTRPAKPISITGPTSSTPASGGEHSVRVSIPTQAGPVLLSVSLYTVDAGPRWLVDAPLPSLPTENVASPSTTSTSTPHTTTTTTTPRTTSPAPSPTPGSTQPSPVQPSPTPVPVPGPIPIPSLDTPIPGQIS